MQHIYRTYIQIYLYLENGTNTNMNNILRPFYLNIQIFLLNTDRSKFGKRLTDAILYKKKVTLDVYLMHRLDPDPEKDSKQIFKKYLYF